MHKLPQVNRRTVLKGTLAASAVGFGTAAFSGQAVAQSERSFVVQQDDTLFCVTALSNEESIENFYDYFGAESHTSTDIEQEDASLLFMYEYQDNTSLVIIHDDGTAGGGGGAATFDISGLPTGSGQWVVQDDGGDFDSSTDTLPDWAWTAENTDGGAWRGGLNGDFEITIDPAFNEKAKRSPLGGGDPTGDARIDEWTTTAAKEGFYVYVRTQLRTREQQYRQALDRDAVLVVPPVELRSDRTIRQTMVGHSDAFSGAIESLPDSVDVEVLRTGTYDRASGAQMSDRQREALTAAWDAGYYEVPREGDIEAVAGELDCASSTASDLLRRAERRIVAAALDERL